MIYLNDKIVAYLSLNNIVFSSGDFETAQQANEEDQIVYWNNTKLGIEPSLEQLDNAFNVWKGTQVAIQNKAQAMQLLRDTDWTATMDVSDPQYSNPYLANQTEFLQYRSEVRKIAINPPSEEAVFPSIPEEVWSA